MVEYNHGRFSICMLCKMNGLKFVLSLLACVVLASANKTSIDGDNYIINGRPANPNQFPWVVALRSTFNEHFCGGFVLSNRWVGSAATCTQGAHANPQNVIAATGSHTRFDGNRHRVIRIINHPQYNARTRANDISVLQTADQIPINPQGPVRAITFPSSANIPDNAPAYFAGWGVDDVSNRRLLTGEYYVS